MAGKPFYDRDLEMGEIGRLVRQDRPQLVIVYGSRGVGKSEVLKRVFAGSNFYYYEATKRVLTQQLADMHTALLQLQPPPALTGRPETVEGVLDVLARTAMERPDTPFPIVLDELPNLADVDPGLLNALEKWFKRQKADQRKNIKLFLAGSRVSWMRREAVSEDAALKTVRTGNLEVVPLNYRFAARFYENFDPMDRVRAWGVWGGLPVNLEEIDGNESLYGNIENTTLRPTARLYAEPEWIKYTELRGDAIYASIVRAIAMGQRTPGGIAVEVGRKSASEISFYLPALREAHIVERIPSLTAQGEAARIAMYFVTDPFLAYWYRFVDPYRSILERGLQEQVIRQLKDPDHGLDKYISEQAFEDVCRSFLYEAARERRLPSDLRFDRVGKWWRGRKGEPSDELDVVAYSGKHLVALGECKWTNDPVGEGTLRDLDRIRDEASAELRPHSNCYRLLFSRVGFTPEVRARAARPAERILLVEPKNLYW